MASFCKHHPHRVIDDIRSPKWSTNQVLISVDKVKEGIDDYLIIFSDESPKNKYGWFWLSGKDIRKSSTQPNGRGRVYAVDLNKREEFIPINSDKCGHTI